MHFSMCVISVQVTVSLGYFLYYLSIVCNNICISLHSFLAELLKDFSPLWVVWSLLRSSSVNNSAIKFLKKKFGKMCLCGACLLWKIKLQCTLAVVPIRLKILKLVTWFYSKLAKDFILYCQTPNYIIQLSDACPNNNSIPRWQYFGSQEETSMNLSNCSWHFMHFISS